MQSNRKEIQKKFYEKLQRKTFVLTEAGSGVGQEKRGGKKKANTTRKQTHGLTHSFVQLLLSTNVWGAGIQIKDTVAVLKELQNGLQTKIWLKLRVIYRGQPHTAVSDGVYENWYLSLIPSVVPSTQSLRSKVHLKDCPQPLGYQNSNREAKHRVLRIECASTGKTTL